VASRSAVLRGAQAAPGGARPTAAPQGSIPFNNGRGLNAPGIGQVSPLAAQLANESGYASAYGPFLPRPTRTFTEGAFGPFSPILPVPVDAPQEDLERPEARRFQYPVGWNLPTGQPGNEGLKLASFSTLRSLADSYSIARACVEYRKNQIRGIEWDITPTPDAQKAYQNNPAKLADFGRRRAKALKFFKRPDPNFSSYATWLSALLEEVLVFDALSLLIRPVRGKGLGKGVLGSDLDSLVLVNGATIRPLLNLHGGTPRPPAPAYQQFLYGVPRSDIMSMITRDDIEKSGLSNQEIAEFRGDQMMYVPMVPRTWTPYGFPPIERALIPIYSGLQKQAFIYDWFSENTIPAAYVIPGDTAMTPNQMRELQDALNAIAGDPAFMQKIIVLPPNSKIEPQKKASAADELDQWLTTELTMAFGLTPLEIGVTPGRSSSSSSGAQNQMQKQVQNASEDTGVTPLLRYLADIFNAVLNEVCGQTDMAFTFEGLQQEEDQDALTGILVQQFQNGMRTLDECRQELNLQPFGTPETSEPLIVSPTGVMPISVAVDNAVNAAAQQQAQTAQTQASTQSTQANAAATQSRTQISQESHEVRMNEAPPMQAGAPAQSGQPKAPAQPGSAQPSQPAAQPGRAAASAANAELATTRKLVSDPVTQKRAAAEFEALARHLGKGRPVSTWDARFIPQSALSDVAKGMAEGLRADEAVAVAKLRVVRLPETEYEWAEKASGQSSSQSGTPLTEAGSITTGATTAAEASTAIAAGTLAAVDVADRLSRWPGWQRDREVAIAYEPRLQAAFRNALGAVRSFFARLFSGAVRLTPVQAAQEARELLAKSVTPELESLWREGYALGTQSAAAMVAAANGEPAATPVWSWEPGDGAPGLEQPGLTQLLEQSGKSIVQGICETRLDDLPLMIGTALAADSTADELAARVESALNLGSRCGTIATTELARAIGCGAMDRYRQDGVDRKDWLCAPDERVCKVCRGNEADGAIPLDQAFNSGATSGNAHPNCFPAGTLVEGPGVVATTDRVYNGDLVTIVLENGSELTGTPNHPVLTPDGWAALGNLHESENVLGAIQLDAVLNPDNYQTVTCIEKAASFLRESGPVSVVKMPSTAVDFHGDGTVGYDVDIVNITRSVKVNDATELIKKRSENQLVLASGCSCGSNSMSEQLLSATSASSSTFVSSFQHGISLLSSSRLPSQQHRGTHISDFDIMMPQNGIDDSSADLEIFRQTLRRFSGSVPAADLSPERFELSPTSPDSAQSDTANDENSSQSFTASRREADALCERLSGHVSVHRIIKVRRVNNWSGHVYNLETSEGWYTANGIISHNCRCTIAPASVHGLDLTDMRVEPLPGFNVVPMKMPAVVKVGPEGYVHGWIHVGPEDVLPPHGAIRAPHYDCSLSRHASGGRLSPEREQLHRQIIAGILDHHRQAASPVATFFGGGTASGKSSVLKPADGDVHIDADQIKEQLPEYREMLKNGDSRAAMFTHDESKLIAARVMSNAIKHGMSFTFDSTGTGRYEAMQRRFNEAREAGYHVAAKYVTADTEKAVRRAAARAKETGRVVPESVVRDTHTSVTNTFRRALDDGLFDSAELHDNNGKSPKMAGSLKPGGAWQVRDPAAWKAFSNKSEWWRS
jgi:predicted ABC-type ATPase